MANLGIWALSLDPLRKRALVGQSRGHMKAGTLLTFILCLAASEDAAACYERVAGMQRRFVLNGGEAFDTKTSLTWKRCSVGLKWNGHGCAGEMTAANLTEATRAADAEGPAWRVPSGPELQSLIDRDCGTPVVDRTVFPDIRRDDEGTAPYWSTNGVGMAGLYYFFDFITGQADAHSRGFHLAVRLVKTGR